MVLIDVFPPIITGFFGYSVRFDYGTCLDWWHPFGACGPLDARN
jgi:hypothetical protein